MGIQKRKVSPRQKMINLMYVVLMAMLALNVSSDVLNGFSLVDESLNRSTTNAATQNAAIYATLEAAMQQNPEKTRQSYERAQQVKDMSDSLYRLAEDLKWSIAREADGSDADINNLSGKENLEAATHVMLAPGTGRGHSLYSAINAYRERIVRMVSDQRQRRIIGDNLSTDVPRRGKVQGKNWQQYMFENTPVAAAITLLTKLQNDVRYAEGEVLHQLVANIDVKDVRVNQISAFVIPSAQTVVRGGKYSARIIMAAVDTTQRPDIYIGGRPLGTPDGRYETICGATGEFTLRGYLQMRNGDGEIIRRDFEQPYTVVDPSATVSATLMNMLYAGYTNPISISVPGIPTGQISATMSGGTLTKKADGQYTATPTQPGTDAIITVTALNEGRQQEMGKFTFHVRKLPDPSAYIEIPAAGGTTDRYKGLRGVAKAALLNAPGVSAAIDDGLLDIPFRVTSFELVYTDNMGNAMKENSAGAAFSDRQRAVIRQMARGKRFNISRVHATGPDGIDRTLPYALEVIVN